INNLSLEILPGQTVGIVGPTGAGKSSMIKLLMRMYDIHQGKVILDGNELREYQFDSLAQIIGFVSQDVYLFHGTVKENICYGSFDANEEQIVQAAELAEAHEFIADLPNGYDTIVGERGIKLSGGQRQRISLARAIL